MTRAAALGAVSVALLLLGPPGVQGSANGPAHPGLKAAFRILHTANGLGEVDPCG